MRLASSAFVLALIAAIPNSASAQQFKVFRLFNETTQQCLTVESPNAPDGGRLVFKPCQNFADFFVTMFNAGTTPLQFQLNSQRFLCITHKAPLTDNPSRQPVFSRECAGGETMWRLIDVGDSVKIITDVATPPSNRCLAADAQGTVFTDLCEAAEAKQWKRQFVTLPGTP